VAGSRRYRSGFRTERFIRGGAIQEIVARERRQMDASGGSVFLNLLGGAEGALIRAAASTQPFAHFALENHKRVRDPTML